MFDTFTVPSPPRPAAVPSKPVSPLNRALIVDITDTRVTTPIADRLNDRSLSPRPGPRSAVGQRSDALRARSRLSANTVRRGSYLDERPEVSRFPVDCLHAASNRAYERSVPRLSVPLFSLLSARTRTGPLCPPGTRSPGDDPATESEWIRDRSSRPRSSEDR